jgi:hypothetical protein
MRSILILSAFFAAVPIQSATAQDPESIRGCWDVTPEKRKHPVRIRLDSVPSDFWRREDHLKLTTIGLPSIAGYAELSFWKIDSTGRLRAVLHYRFVGLDFDLSFAGGSLTGTAKWFSDDREDPLFLGKVTGRRIECPPASS